MKELSTPVEGAVVYGYKEVGSGWNPNCDGIMFMKSSFSGQASPGIKLVVQYPY
jgi:hypothetical protein